MTPDERALLAATVLDNPYCKQKPTAKQAEFLVRPELEALYGGAAAGGKSSALLMAGLQYVEIPDYSALILRRTYSDLALPGAIMDRSFDWLRETDAHWRDKDKTWDFPSGATLTFGYLENDKDRYRYQSSEFQFVGFDELTQFSDTQYTYLFSRLRRLKNHDVPIRMRSASNPGGIGHDWVKARFIPPSDISRIFIGAKLDDNPHIDRLAYEESLSKLDYVTREQLRNGDWGITESGGMFFEPKLYPIKNPDFKKDIDLRNCEVYAACDPSEGGSDFAAIGAVIKLHDGRVLAWACDMAVDNHSTTIGKIIEFQKLYKPVKFWIESNSLGHAPNAPGMSLFEKDLRDRMGKEKVTVPFAWIWNTRKKEDRIRAMEPHYSNGTLLFRSDYNQEYPMLISQLKGFKPGNKMHDDGPDMLEMCVSGVLENSLDRGKYRKAKSGLTVIDEDRPSSMFVGGKPTPRPNF
jgi:predicted phage terminase large subunit-like protein